MPRVVGTDPGTSSLDLLLLDDGAVAAQTQLEPETLRSRPTLLVETLRSWGPIDLIAGPSGYGLPLVRAGDLTDRDRDLMSLVRPEERGNDLGVIGFRGWVRALVASSLPVVFLPGGIHLPTIPSYRKANAIDLGTADKVAVVALALRTHAASGVTLSEATFAVVEVGSAFTAVLVVSNGAIVDASAGTRGPIGVRSAGAWDGEAAYWLGPLSKADLFRGGLTDLGDDGPPAFRESLVKHVAGLQAIAPFETLYVSGSRADLALGLLDRFGTVLSLPNLPGATVKHAAQGAALLADGLAGGRHAGLVAALRLREAAGTSLDGLMTRRASEGS
ncbi:MAG TPA: DUF1464 family protein [Isosphaeraceae bacterium]|jgi:predicted butyrate kinase (DUF1464 family)|nr:DUF1464 family protein [Isosphaeraceae bacterium]